MHQINSDILSVILEFVALNDLGDLMETCNMFKSMTEIFIAQNKDAPYKLIISLCDKLSWDIHRVLRQLDCTADYIRKINVEEDGIRRHVLIKKYVFILGQKRYTIFRSIMCNITVRDHFMYVDTFPPEVANMYYFDPVDKVTYAIAKLLRKFRVYENDTNGRHDIILGAFDEKNKIETFLDLCEKCIVRQSDGHLIGYSIGDIIEHKFIDVYF